MGTVLTENVTDVPGKIKYPTFIHTDENYSMYDKPRVEDTYIWYEPISKEKRNNIQKPYVATDDYYERFLDTQSKIYGINYMKFEDKNTKLNNCIVTPEPIPFFSNMRVTAVSTGTFHTTFLNSMGKVYSIGTPSSISNRTVIGGEPKLIEYFKDIPIASISCGNYDTIFLDTTGKAYGLSYSEEAILGHGCRATRWLTEPTLFECGFKTVSVASGLSHTLYIDNANRVYGVGYNDEGQLGLDIDTALMNTPCPIAYFHNITISSVTAGATHTIFIDKSGNPYSCGNNEYGQLGIMSNQNAKMPEHITYFSDIQILSGSAGSFHTILLDTKGKVYAFGNNKYGQLGISLDNDIVATPELIAYFDDIPIKSVSCGATHTIFLDTRGKVYSTGGNKFGQLGLGDKIDRKLPEPIKYFENIKIASINAGGTHTIFTDTMGKVYAAGYNENNQLGISNIKTMEKREPIEDVEIYWKVPGEWWVIPK
jgi:alpha-tubulin suppressor-like RCC1 family protein